jgi:multidrug efflux pump subunit AcrB
VLAGVKLPVGYSLEVGGLYESQRQAFRELLLVSGVATALVFLILVIQFRSFTSSLLILLAAPLSLGGALAMLILTDTELNVSSAMGLILLVGLVVKNGIVLLDFVEMRRAEGLPLDEAVLAAARIRVRPILMTTLCTLFGLLPLALGLGAGAELQRPQPLDDRHALPRASGIPRVCTAARPHRLVLSTIDSCGVRHGITRAAARAWRSRF